MSEDGIGRFRRFYEKPPTRYGRYSDEELLTLRDELRALWRYQAERCAEFTTRTRKIHETYERVPELPLQKIICEHWLRYERLPFEVTWTKQQKRIRANPQCLPAVLAWACVLHARNLKFCKNPDCECRFYLASRKDQKFCSAECAAPAKRAAKRRWWSEHRSKTTQN